MHDAIVIGSGPSGSQCGLRLAEKGFDVLMVEKESHPRRKVCGGAVSEKAIQRYSIPPKIGKEVSDALFCSPSQHTFTARSRDRLAILVPRERLDELLVRRAVEAGASLLVGEDVKAVAIDADCARAKVRGRTLKARVIIGADGFASTVARSMGLQPESWLGNNAFCPVAYIPGRMGAPQPQVEFYFGLVDVGYAWIFHHVGHLNVGIGSLLKSYVRPPQDELKAFIGRHPIASRRLRDLAQQSVEFSGAYLPYNGILRKTFSDRLLLVGDAAGFVSTLTGEGIFYSMKSAEIAADVLEEALTEGDLSQARLSKYQRRWKRDPELGQDIALGLLIRRLIFGKSELLDRIMIHCRDDEQLQRLLLDLVFTRGEYRKTARELLKRLPASVNLSLFGVSAGSVIKLALGRASPFFPTG